jgi:hypothetical protein
VNKIQMANDRVHAGKLQYSSMQQPFVSFTDAIEIFYYYSTVEGLDPNFMKLSKSNSASCV